MNKKKGGYLQCNYSNVVRVCVCACAQYTNFLKSPPTFFKLI